MSLLGISGSLIVYILIQIALWSARLWLSRVIFPQHLMTRERYIISAGGGLAAIFLVSYPVLISYLPSSYELMYLPGQSWAVWWLAALLVYAMLYTMSWAPWRNLSGDRHKFAFFVITLASMVLLLILAWRTKFYFPVTLIGYYLIVAATEELFKFSPTRRNFKSYDTVHTDLILFGIMSAFGFALLENIRYGWHMLQHLDSIPVALGIGRWVIGFMMHGIFSWTTAFLLTRHFHIKKKIPVLWGLLAVLWWVSLHTLYNLFLVHHIGIGLILYLIIAYMGISYLFFNASRLYVHTQKTALE